MLLTGDTMYIPRHPQNEHRRMRHASSNQKRGVALTSDKIDSKIKIVHRDQAYFIMIKGSTYQGDKPIIKKKKVYPTAGSRRASKPEGLCKAESNVPEKNDKMQSLIKSISEGTGSLRKINDRASPTRR